MVVPIVLLSGTQQLSADTLPTGSLSVPRAAPPASTALPTFTTPPISFTATAAPPTTLTTSPLSFNATAGTPPTFATQPLSFTASPKLEHR
jgi:hypothetical protein